MVLNTFRSFVIFFFVRKIFPVFFCLLKQSDIFNWVQLCSKKKAEIAFSKVKSIPVISFPAPYAAGLFKVKPGSVPTVLILAHFD